MRVKFTKKIPSLSRSTCDPLCVRVEQLLSEDGPACWRDGLPGSLVRAAEVRSDHQHLGTERSWSTGSRFDFSSDRCVTSAKQLLAIVLRNGMLLLQSKSTRVQAIQRLCILNYH